MTADTDWKDAANEACLKLRVKKAKKKKSIREVVETSETRFGCLVPWGGAVGGGSSSGRVT